MSDVPDWEQAQIAIYGRLRALKGNRTGYSESVDWFLGMTKEAFKLGYASGTNDTLLEYSDQIEMDEG